MQPQDPKENAESYAESQKQRSLERKLREEKRQLEIMKAQGASPEDIAAQKRKVSTASSNIAAFCDETGRTRKRKNEYTPVNASFDGADLVAARMSAYSLTNSGKNDIILFEDTYIPRSLGAKATNYDIYDADGKVYHYLEGTRGLDTKVFAGYKTRHQLHDGVAEGLSELHGGEPEKWQHVKGIGTIDVDGEGERAEVHWFYQESTGQVGHKIKKWLDR